jgi:hypothetical protein
LEAAPWKVYNNTRSTRRAAYEIFESFMFDQIQKNRCDVSAILVICGSYHVERLAKLFSKAGDEVQWEDTYYASSSHRETWRLVAPARM